MQKSARRIIQPPNQQHGVKYEGLVATRCGMYDANLGGGSLMARSYHIATTDIFALKAVFANFGAINTSGAEDSSGGATTKITASVEYPSGNIANIFTFSGQTQGAIPTGGVIFTDYARVMIPKGAAFWIRHYDENFTGVLASFNHVNDFANGDRINGVAGSSQTDFTTGGTCPEDGSSNYSAVPLALIGMTSTPSVLIVGDSVAFGFNDSKMTDYRRGCIARSFGSSLGFVNIAISGAAASDWLTKDIARRNIYPYFTHVICQLNINDLLASRTSAQIITDIGSILQKFRPGTRTTLTTGTPFPGATTDPTIQAQRHAFNAAVRAGTVPYVNNGYYEIANAVETAQDSDTWITGYSDDGLHPNGGTGYPAIVSSGNVKQSQLWYP